MEIQINDDVIFEMVEDTILEVYDNEDIEMYNPVEEEWRAGEKLEATICDIQNNFYGAQFGDSSFNFIHKDSVNIIPVNP